MSQIQPREKEFWMESRAGEIGLAIVKKDLYKTILDVECLNGNQAASNYKWEIYGNHGLLENDKVLYFKEMDAMVQPHHLYRVGKRSPIERMKTGIGFGRIIDDEAPEAYKVKVEWVNWRPVQIPEEERILTFNRNFVHPMTSIRYGMEVLMLLESSDGGIMPRFVIESGRGDCMED